MHHVCWPEVAHASITVEETSCAMFMTESVLAGFVRVFVSCFCCGFVPRRTFWSLASGVSQVVDAGERSTLMCGLFAEKFAVWLCTRIWSFALYGRVWWWVKDGNSSIRIVLVQWNMAFNVGHQAALLEHRCPSKTIKNKGHQKRSNTIKQVLFPTLVQSQGYRQPPNCSSKADRSHDCRSMLFIICSFEHAGMTAH